MWQPTPETSAVPEGRPYAVYFLYDADDRLLYVGRTADVNQRFSAWSVEPWWPRVARFELDFYETYPEAYNAERREILERNPLLNKQRFEPSETPPLSPPKRPEPRRAPPGPGWVSTKVAAQGLGVTAPTLTRWVKARTVMPAFVTLGGHYKWDLDDLKRQLSA